VAFYLNNYTRTDELLAAINDIQYGGHPPNLSAGLNAVRTDIFNASNGARHDPSVMRLAVVFVTENPSSNRLPTMIEAREAADMDIGIVTVGVGTFVDRQLLSSITSYPSSKNLQVVPSVRNVTDLTDSIKRIICSGEPDVLCSFAVFDLLPGLCLLTYLPVNSTTQIHLVSRNVSFLCAIASR